MRSIKKIHSAEDRPIADLKTVSPLPSTSINMLDPFLFLNHHGPQVYKPNNQGLPFGPHPHRGIETVTFILDGDILHKDSENHESIITSGGIQWMTAGKGLMHSETSSQEFKENGGPLEILQLWINLPAKFKMTTPNYIGLQENEIPHISLHDNSITIDLLAGKWDNQQAPIKTLTDILLTSIHFKPNSELKLIVPKEETIFFYVVRGKLNVNGTTVEQTQLAEFNYDSEELTIKAETNALLLFGHAMPFNEPVVAHGPFVMNTEQEIYEAYEDYRQGKFGMM